MIGKVYSLSFNMQSFNGLHKETSINKFGSHVKYFHAVVATSIHLSVGKGNRGVVVVMFECFNENAIRVIMLAQEKAQQLGHNYIGYEHLFLGMLREEAMPVFFLEQMKLLIEKINKLDQYKGNINYVFTKELLLKMPTSNMPVRLIMQQFQQRQLS